MTGTIWAQTVSVTLSVDMNSQDVAAEGVHVAGNFQGWDPAGTMLTDDDMDGIYEVTLDVADSLATIQYKFLNGNAWGVDEVVSRSLRFSREAPIAMQTLMETRLYLWCALALAPPAGSPPFSSR